MIDYVQRIQSTDNRRPRHEQLEEISAAVKERIARAFNVPVILLCQLNRDGGGKPPRTEDLKGSGSLEQDADVIISVGLNSFMTPAPKENTRLAESLTSLSTTLASFEQRQSGSEADLTQQLASLAGIVAQTHKASSSQIESLTRSLAEVRSVAMQAADKSAFTNLLEDFGKDLDKKVEDQINSLVKAEVEEEAPPAKVCGCRNARREQHAGKRRRAGFYPDVP